MKDFRVHIAGLSEKVHSFTFGIGEEFFAHYGKELVPSGNLKATVELDKRETMLIATFRIEGSLQLVCDRTLEPFEHPVVVDRKVHFKFGAEFREIDDEVIFIRKEAETLDLGQFFYEFIALSVPMKRLHPRLQEASPDAEGLVYSSSTDSGPIADPRWDALKKIK